MMPSLQSAVPVRLSPPPRQSLFRASLILGVSFCLVYGWSVRAMFNADTLGSAEGVLLVLKVAVEMGFSFVAATMFLVAVTYLFVRDDYRPPANEPGAPLPPVGILYLCCNDLDADAVRSLARL